MVEATDPAGTVKVQLSDQFQVLIDAVAMKLGLAGTDEYLEQWSTGMNRSAPAARMMLRTPWPRSLSRSLWSSAPALSDGRSSEAGAPLIECVPNVSEGRDTGIIRRLGEAVESGGARLLDIHSDVDHHRSVFTIVGDAEAVERSVLALARTAVDLIDLTKHRGAHPRIGAIDVVPFVPLR